jgi:hypothetical protein
MARSSAILPGFVVATRISLFFSDTDIDHLIAIRATAQGCPYMTTIIHTEKENANIIEKPSRLGGILQF